MTKIYYVIDDGERYWSDRSKSPDGNDLELTIFNDKTKLDWALYDAKLQYKICDSSSAKLESIIIESENGEFCSANKAMENLKEKIKQATPKWEGIDADKFLDEVRGRDDE